MLFRSSHCALTVNQPTRRGNGFFFSPACPNTFSASSTGWAKLLFFFFHEETGSFQGFPGQSRIPGGKSLCGTAAAFSRKSLETRIQNIDRISTNYRLYRQNINKLSTNMSIISADLKQTPSRRKPREKSSSERKPAGQKTTKREKPS